MESNSFVSLLDNLEREKYKIVQKQGALYPKTKKHVPPLLISWTKLYIVVGLMSFCDFIDWLDSH